MLLRTTALGLALSAVMPASYAFAQTLSTSGAVLAADVIVVTAQRREQDLTEVPLSLTVVNGDLIDKEGITSTSELETLVPSLSFVSSGTRTFTRPIIRGIGDNIVNGTDSNVGVYLDDVPLPSYLANFDLLDVERVEVIRGPVGTLFGQSGLAGAINVITRSPSDEVEAAGQISYGSYDELDVQAYISGPITDRARAKLVARYRDFGGFIDNELTGEKFDPSENVGLRGVLSFDATDALTIDITADYADDQGAEAQYVPFESYTFNTLDEFFSNRENFGVSGRIKYSGDDIDVVSITAYREFEYEDLAEIGATFAFENTQRQFSEEIRVSSSIGDNFNWLLGGYFFDEHFTQNQLVDIPFFINTTYDAEVNTQTIAVFGDATYALTPALDITAGLRYSTINVDGFVITNQTNFVFPPLGLSVFNNPQDLNFNEVSGRVALLYRATDDISLFASWSNGFKPGTFSLYSVQNDDPAVGSETANSFDLGVRGVAFDDMLTFDASVFYVLYDDRQTFEQVPGTGGGVLGFTNAGEGSYSRGVEASTNLKVNDYLSISASATYMDTEQKGAVVNQFDTTSFQDVDVDASGNEFGLASNFRSTVGIDYSQPITNNISGFIRGRWRFVDSFFSSDANNPATEVDSYHLANISAGVTVNQFTVSLEVENLFDEYYPLLIQDFGGLIATPGSPRSIVGRIRFRY
ncbi:MAG: TonB-dependent receptor [Pseudomonadota bacterium]